MTELVHRVAVDFAVRVTGQVVASGVCDMMERVKLMWSHGAQKVRRGELGRRGFPTNMESVERSLTRRVLTVWGGVGVVPIGQV